MKFCKNLQRVADLSNPEWSPFWTDYKKLKKLIKRMELDDHPKEISNDTEKKKVKAVTSSDGSPVSSCSSSSSKSDGRHRSQRQQQQQQEGDSTSERVATVNVSNQPTNATKRIRIDPQAASHSGSLPRRDKDHDHDNDDDDHDHNNDTRPQKEGTAARRQIVVVAQPQQQRTTTDQTDDQRVVFDSMRGDPNEVAFFKLLHSEFRKAVHFFDRAIDEFGIREERVRDGMEIIKQQHRGSLWNIFARSVYRLYTDLLLLETYCIMTYCGFSKILKKHDKRTGWDTKNAFMSKVVNNANFTTYSSLQEMIDRCEQVYNEVSERIEEEGESGLYEDERLFIDMIHQLNRDS